MSSVTQVSVEQVREWAMGYPNYAGMPADEQGGVVEGALAYVEAMGGLPESGAVLDEWLNSATEETEEQRKVRLEEELEHKQAAARKELVKVAKEAGRTILRVEVQATVANVKAGRLCRDGIKAYLLVYPRGRQAAEDIIRGQLSEITGQSYKVADLLELAGIADVFGDVSLELSQRRFRELAKLVERTEDGDGWQMMPGIQDGAVKLVKRAADGEVIPMQQWQADIMTLAGVSEKTRATELRTNATALEEEARKLGDTQDARIKLATALETVREAEASDKRAEMWEQRLTKAEQKQAADKANKVLASQPSATSVQPPSQARDVALAWLEDIAKSPDKMTRKALAVKLIGGDFGILRDVLIEAGEHIKTEQRVTLCLDQTDAKGVVSGFLSHIDVQEVPEALEGIRANPELRKAVGKRFGKKQDTDAIETPQAQVA